VSDWICIQRFRFQCIFLFYVLPISRQPQQVGWVPALAWFILCCCSIVLAFEAICCTVVPYFVISFSSDSGDSVKWFWHDSLFYLAVDMFKATICCFFLSCFVPSYFDWFPNEIPWFARFTWTFRVPSRDWFVDCSVWTECQYIINSKQTWSLVLFSHCVWSFWLACTEIPLIWWRLANHICFSVFLLVAAQRHIIF
jgi:hypothetical protein